MKRNAYARPVAAAAAGWALLTAACSSAPKPAPEEAGPKVSSTELGPVAAPAEKVFLGLVHATCSILPTRPPQTDVEVPSPNGCASIAFVLQAENGAYRVRKYPDANGKIDFDVTVGTFYRLDPEAKRGWVIERKGNDRLQTGDTVDFILRRADAETI